MFMRSIKLAFDEFASSRSIKHLKSICLINCNQHRSAYLAKYFSQPETTEVKKSVHQRLTYSQPQPSTTNAKENFSITVKTSGQREISASEHAAAATSTVSGNTNYFCVLCQCEDQDLIIKCNGATCTSAFCDKCLFKYEKTQHTTKCPNCPAHFDQIKFNRLKENFNQRNTNRSNISKPQHGHNYRSEMPSGGFQDNYYTKHGIRNGEFKLEIIDSPCEGYENLRSYKITFTFKNGIQNERQPRPGEAYEGLIKYAYLPVVPEAKEILALLEKALRFGLLFRVAQDDKGGYKVTLNSTIKLKTFQRNGGSFGYPDNRYVYSVLQDLRACIKEIELT